MALCVLCKKTNKQGALLGLSRVCRQITKATGKSMSMMATRPRSLTGSKVLPYTCDLQVGRRAAAIRAPVSALKLWNCLRYLIASSTELECALMDAHAYCQVQHRRSLPRQPTCRSQATAQAGSKIASRRELLQWPLAVGLAGLLSQAPGMLQAARAGDAG